MLKDNASSILSEILNDCIKNGTLAYEVKLADILPTAEEIDSNTQKIYRPISTSRLMSKLLKVHIEVAKPLL